jgi:hypothetical protein
MIFTDLPYEMSERWNKENLTGDLHDLSELNEN